MEEIDYVLNLSEIAITEYMDSRRTFSHIAEFARLLLLAKDIVIYEDELIEKYKDHPRVLSFVNNGKTIIEAITSIFPDRIVCEGEEYPDDEDDTTDNEQTGRIMWLDLCADCIITPEDEYYDLFFVYKLRQTDLLEIDNFLANYSDANYSSSKAFLRFLRLALRKHSARLLTPAQLETINEWMVEHEKESSISKTEEARSKGRPKRERDDNVTLLGQEQTALLIYCLRKTKIVLPDEFLNNREAGQAFSILTGFSADTIRQNLSKSEVARLATTKNVNAVTQALKALSKFIENEVKPEE